VFRIAQEALANIARHARAANVQVRIYQQEDDENGALWLKIKDDGSGFDPARIIEGMGFTNIRTRASELGGKAQIEGRPNEGTSIVVSIPLVETESVEIKGQLRNAAIIATVGYFVCGYIAGYMGKESLVPRLLGLPLFGFAVIGYMRASNAINQARSTKTISRVNYLSLKRYLHPTHASLAAGIAWWLISWIAIYLPDRMAGWPLLAPLCILCLLAIPLYDLYRLRQIIKEEYSLSSPRVFYRSITPMWRQAGATLLGALILTGYYTWLAGDYSLFPI